MATYTVYSDGTQVNTIEIEPAQIPMWEFITGCKLVPMDNLDMDE